MVSKRSIFEEVSDFDTERANPKIKTGIIEKAELISDRIQIRAWLICLSLLLVFMILRIQSGDKNLIPKRNTSFKVSLASSNNNSTTKSIVC